MDITERYTSTIQNAQNYFPLEMANFLTADGNIIITADGNIFNATEA